MSRIFYSLLLTLFILPAHAAEHIFTPLLGISDWSDSSGHTARGSTISFDDSNEITYGFRYLYLFDTGLAVGGNIYLYEKDVTTTGQAHDAGVGHFHVLAEYFFNPASDFSPFIGIGLGASAIAFSGGNLDGDGTGGSSYELNGGVLFRLTDVVGLQLEYKYTGFDIDEAIHSQHTNIDSNAHSLLLGLTIHY